ncbi:uncharacterized protein PRCAT00001466001 [Priceomyces carsonii]|uniref:uncharacterized protein n=1 Tax=Priceomyces carsonii TaxID=28549 RepID=UPI002EDA691C|nr:unnamed protein product [Priceomyces carsonii]
MPQLCKIPNHTLFLKKYSWIYFLEVYFTMTFDTTIVKKTQDIDRVNEVLVSAFKDVGTSRLFVRRLHKIPDTHLELDEKLFDFRDRLSYHLKQGGIILESNDFNAIAIWYSPDVKFEPFASPDEQTRPAIVEKFYNSSLDAKHNYFKDNRFWYLNTLARNKNQEPIKGAISVIIDPVVKECKLKSIPIYVEAISEHAKEIYLHYGFEIIRTLTLGKAQVDRQGIPARNGEGVNVYFMVLKCS